MSARLEKTELYLGRGEASMALAISSLKVASERTDGRTLDCCILRGCDSFLDEIFERREESDEKIQQDDS